MRFNEALELARSKRNKINPNVGFVEQLKKLEKEVFGESSVETDNSDCNKNNKIESNKDENQKSK